MDICFIHILKANGSTEPTNGNMETMGDLQVAPGSQRPSLHGHLQPTASLRRPAGHAALRLSRHGRRGALPRAQRGAGGDLPKWLEGSHGMWHSPMGFAHQTGFHQQNDGFDYRSNKKNMKKNTHKTIWSLIV